MIINNPLNSTISNPTFLVVPEHHAEVIISIHLHTSITAARCYFHLSAFCSLNLSTIKRPTAKMVVIRPINKHQHAGKLMPLPNKLHYINGHFTNCLVGKIANSKLKTYFPSLVRFVLRVILKQLLQILSHSYYKT